jgi:hypothetical protein
VIVLDICFFDGLVCKTSFDCLVDVGMSGCLPVRCKRFVMVRRCRFVDLPRDSRRRKAVPVVHI